MSLGYHDHSGRLEKRTPTVERVVLTRVTFLRGVGCCEQSVLRAVQVYYDEDGVLLFEKDEVNE